MKKLLLLLVFITSATAFRSAAQDYATNTLDTKIYPGTVTTLDGKVVEGYVLNRSSDLNQKECIFFSNANDQRSKKIYRPEDLIGYSIENYQYKSLNYTGPINFGKAARKFAFVAKAGVITTFFYFSPDKEIFWTKGNGEPVTSTSLAVGFKKNLAKLIGDDAELMGKVERKEKGYGMLNILDIISEYNQRALTKTQ